MTSKVPEAVIVEMKPGRELDDAVAEALGWTLTNLKSDFIIRDDGCLVGFKCEDCGVAIGYAHKEDCKHLLHLRVWRMTSASWADTGDPKRSRIRYFWRPSTDPKLAVEILQTLSAAPYGYEVYLGHQTWGWDCSFQHPGDKGGQAHGDDPDRKWGIEESICKAALIALSGRGKD